jgi:hypothetical protein
LQLFHQNSVWFSIRLFNDQTIVLSLRFAIFELVNIRNVFKEYFSLFKYHSE